MKNPKVDPSKLYLVCIIQNPGSTNTLKEAKFIKEPDYVLSNDEEVMKIQLFRQLTDTQVKDIKNIVIVISAFQ